MPFRHADALVVAVGIDCRNRIVVTNERDKARQGIVADSLNLFRNGAVGFIGWLGVQRRAGQATRAARMSSDGPRLIQYHVAKEPGSYHSKQMSIV